jgi:hypothetical protein
MGVSSGLGSKLGIYEPCYAKAASVAMSTSLPARMRRIRLEVSGIKRVK